MLNVGDKAPNFELSDDQGKTISLKDLQGKKIVLYFYPKDDTPGCTSEACDFRDNLTQFHKKNAVVLGVSKDNVKSHQKFKNKYDLTFPLLADEGGKICESYGVLVEKSMFGKKYMGINRVTFLIDEQGIIEKIWPKVKVAGHAEQVLAQI